MLYRKAKISDVESIHALITYHAGRGQMLARPRTMLYESLREFSIVEHQGLVIGAGALNIIWEDLAEIRALAVAPEYAGQGIGRSLVNMFIDEARELGIPRVFVLTYQQEFFEKCGFQVIAKEALPQKVWRECIHCPKFPNCEEIAMIKDILA
ncbi:MAG: Amino-acid acetyltransferase [Pelotomaculum sp. PtaB.Bin104]|nr:MAG: Amino-acid acetyltransferase [Pelotomaculum sp. PtaB.Bin104]